MSDPLIDALTEFLTQARWFGGKGRAFTVTDLREHDLPADPSAPVAAGAELPEVRIALARVSYADGGEDLYQVPLAAYDAPQDRLNHALIAMDAGRYVYDALHDRIATDRWLRAFAAAASSEAAADGTAAGRLRFRRSGEQELDLEVHSTLFSGEQSNTSIAFGDQSLMKSFRRLTPGINPDIEIHAALTRSGSDQVAELYGWLELESEDESGEPLQLALLQEFLRTASDGWQYALSSARNLFAEGDLHPDEVGGDFAGEAARLGGVVADTHLLLAQVFPTGEYAGQETAAWMRARFAEAAAAAPALAAYDVSTGAVYDRLDGATGVAQRVHGDLHLGQTLRTALGWKLVDFEGEPAKPLAERRQLDSPWRDVAGMLRSFDYAARSAARDVDVTEEQLAQVAYRAEEWVQHNRRAFLTGYAEARGAPLNEDEHALIAAYETDKAVYEVLYETRNRPSWVDIPLGALERLTTRSDPRAARAEGEDR